MDDSSVVIYGHELYGGDAHVDVLHALTSGVKQVFAGMTAFAAVKEDNTLWLWGSSIHANSGHHYMFAPTPMEGIAEILSSSWTNFVARKTDGTIICIGIEYYGGGYESDLADSKVLTVVSAHYGFAALREDRTVDVFGYSGHYFPPSSEIQEQLTNVDYITATAYAFAALTFAGKVIAFGHPSYAQVDTTTEALLQCCVVLVVSSRHTFVALRNDNQVVTFGSTVYGSDEMMAIPPAVAQAGGATILSITSNIAAFAAVDDTGVVYTWGSITKGGDSSEISSFLESDVVSITGDDTWMDFKPIVPGSPKCPKGQGSVSLSDSTSAWRSRSSLFQEAIADERRGERSYQVRRALLTTNSRAAPLQRHQSLHYKTPPSPPLARSSC
jgi:alpha-tubulin suppressor-like RCC1 family protein